MRSFGRAIAVASAVALISGCAAVAPSPSASLPGAPSHATGAASPDFDGDGRADLVVGVGATTPRVSVVYGSGRRQDFTRTDVDGASSYGFGRALLARDLNTDGYTDLVVSDADESFGQQPGLFFVFGSASGLQPGRATRVAAAGLAGGGGALALVTAPTLVLAAGATEVNGDGGAVLLYPLGVGGLPSGDPIRLAQGSGGVPGPGSAGDAFGTTLAASGSLLVVGAPGKDVGKARAAGAIVALTFGDGGQLHGTTWTQDSPDVPGTAEAGDRFGLALAAGDGYVAVGVPLESGESVHAGSVQPFRITADGLAPLPAIAVDDPGVPGEQTAEDRFGAAVAMVRPCPGVPGVLVGAPTRPAGDVDQAGAAWVVPLAGGCPAAQVAPTVRTPKPQAMALVGAGVSALRAGGEAADTLVVVAEGISEEGVPGRVLTLAPPYSASREQLTGLWLGDEGRITLSSPEG